MKKELVQLTVIIIMCFNFLYLGRIAYLQASELNSQNYIFTEELNLKLIDEDMQQSLLPKNSQKIANSYTPHVPIEITSNDDFKNQGFTGSGTTEYPYVFESYIITNSTKTLIHIENTDAYFIIRRNFLDGIANITTGIYLENVSNGRIVENTFINTKMGVRMLLDSHNNTITDNTFKNNYSGIGGGSSYNNTYTNNQIFNNRDGIEFGSPYTTTSGNIIINNTIHDNICSGLSISNASSYLVMNNSVVNNGGGIQIGYEGSGEHNTIYNNSIMGTTGTGLMIDCSSSNITGNTIIQNEYGLTLHDGNNNNVSKNIIGLNNHSINSYWGGGNSITENLIYNNDDMGIELLSKHNVVKWNDFIGNKIYADSQAEAIADNYFSENYWDDWTCPDVDTDGIVDNPYPIHYSTGQYLNTDPSPLTSPHNDIPANLHLLSRPRILYPADWLEELKGTVTVRWCSVTDFSGHSVSYTLYYKEQYEIDDTQYYGNWTELVSGITETEFNWDTSSMRNDASFELRVVARCSEGLTSEWIVNAGYIPFKADVDCWSFTMIALTLCFLVYASRRKKR